MDFLDSLRHNWTIIVFIGGAIWNVAYTWSKIENQKERITKMEKDISDLQKDQEASIKTLSDITGDIKEIKSMLNLLINDKIKR